MDSTLVGNTMNLSFGEFVKFLILLLHRNGIAFSFRNHRAWHLLWYRLKEMPETNGKPIFFKTLVFDWDTEYPVCQELSEFLWTLYRTGSVVTTSPEYEEYRLPKKQQHCGHRGLQCLTKR